MTIKVGDKVKIKSHSCNVEGYRYGDIASVTSVNHDDDGVYLGSGIVFFFMDQIEPVDLLAPNPSNILKDRMDHHMEKGEFVRAIKWAQLAEAAREIENE